MGNVPGNWGPWIAAHFPTQEARDRFVFSVAPSEENGRGAEPMPDDDRGAWVRWRPQQFLAINDIAHSHGGRMVVNVVRRRVV